MTGPIFEEGIPLHIATRALEDVQSIVDKSYLVAINRTRLQQEDRSSFYLRANRIEYGSLNSLIEIVVEHSQIALPILPTLDPELIWTYTKETFNFLKTAFEASQRGQKPRYEFSGDHTHVHIGDERHTYNAPVFHIGELSVNSYRDLAELMGEDGVDSALLASHDAPETNIAFDLQKDDQGLFEIPSRMDDKAVDLECEIFDFNKYENHGRTTVMPYQEVPEGRYPFEVMGDQDQSSYIESMLKSEVILRCLRELKIDPLGESEVVKLHVLSVVNGT